VELKEFGVGWDSRHFVDENNGLVDSINEGVVVSLLLGKDSLSSVSSGNGSSLGISKGDTSVLSVGQGELTVVKVLLAGFVSVSFGL
jgi:hypothetical protein